MLLFFVILFSLLVVLVPISCISWTELTDEQLSTWYRYASPSVLSIVMNNTKCMYEGPVSIYMKNDAQEDVDNTNQHVLASSTSQLVQHFLGCDLCFSIDLDGLHEPKTTIPNRAKTASSFPWWIDYDRKEHPAKFINYHRHAPMGAEDSSSSVLIDTLLYLHRQNKALVMMGDSITRNMMSSLVCEVRRSLGAENVYVHVTITSHTSMVTYTYTITNTSVQKEDKQQRNITVPTSFDVYFVWYNYVMRSGNPQSGNPLRLHHILDTITAKHDGIVLLFNTGVHFNDEEHLFGELHYLTKLMKRIMLGKAFDFSLRVNNDHTNDQDYTDYHATPSFWDNNQTTKNNLVIFRETTLQHFDTSHGQWDISKCYIPCAPVNLTMDQAIQDDWRNQLILAAMVMVGHALNGETQQRRENPTNITVNDTTTTPITTYHLLHHNSENITTTIDNSTSAMSQKKLFLIPFWQYTWDLWDFHIPLDLNKKKDSYDCTHYAWSPMLYQPIYHGLHEAVMSAWGDQKEKEGSGKEKMKKDDNEEVQRSEKSADSIDNHRHDNSNNNNSNLDYPINDTKTIHFAKLITPSLYDTRFPVISSPTRSAPSSNGLSAAQQRFLHVMQQQQHHERQQQQ